MSVPGCLPNWISMIAILALLAGCSLSPARITDQNPTQPPEGIRDTPTPSLTRVKATPTAGQGGGLLTPVPPESVASSTATPSPPVFDPAVDCLQVKRLATDSPAAQQIVQEFVANYQRAYPTEFMDFAAVWGVDQLGEYAVVQGTLTREDSDLFVVRQAKHGFEMVARLTVTAPQRARFAIQEYFAREVPTAPLALFFCLDVSRYLVKGLPQQLDLAQAHDCSQVEQALLESPGAQAVGEAILAYKTRALPEIKFALGQVVSIQRQGDYLLAQASIISNGYLEPLYVFVLEASPWGFQVIGFYNGPKVSRADFLRYVYAELPYLPVELLVCAPLEAFFATPTPAP